MRGRIQDEDHLHTLLCLAANEESSQVAMDSRARDCVPLAKCYNEVGPFIKKISIISKLARVFGRSGLCCLRTHCSESEQKVVYIQGTAPNLVMILFQHLIYIQVAWNSHEDYI